VASSGRPNSWGNRGFDLPGSKPVGDVFQRLTELGRSGVPPDNLAHAKAEEQPRDKGHLQIPFKCQLIENGPVPFQKRWSLASPFPPLPPNPPQ